MAGPATDNQFRTAAARIRAAAAELERATRCWPAVDPALYGETAASRTSGDRLFTARRGVTAVTESLAAVAVDCDAYAQGCSSYYDAYRRYLVQLAAHQAAWSAYGAAHASWASRIGSANAVGVGTIILGPNPAAPTDGAGPSGTGAAVTEPEPQPPSGAAPIEPVCPPYCDPSPVR